MTKESAADDKQGVLSAANSAAFLERYANFYDGLLRKVYLHLDRPKDRFTGDEPHGVTIECSVMINEDPPPGKWADRWVNITLDVEAASRVKIVLGDHTWTVITYGLNIGFFDNEIYFAFDEEAHTREEFLAADFLITGARCRWSVGPYRDPFNY